MALPSRPRPAPAICARSVETAVRAAVSVAMSAARSICWIAPRLKSENRPACRSDGLIATLPQPRQLVADDVEGLDQDGRLIEQRASIWPDHPAEPPIALMEEAQQVEVIIADQLAGVGSEIADAVDVPAVDAGPFVEGCWPVGDGAGDEEFFSASADRNMRLVAAM